MVEPQTKGAARYVGESMPVARGWERQADIVDNPIFYEDGALTAASYRQWLDPLAVSYVAVPATKLDFASVDEAKLIATGLPYLHQVWSNADWKLYRVSDSQPLVRNAQVISVSGNQVRLQVPRGRAGADPDPVVGPPGRARRHPAGVARACAPTAACRRTATGRCCTRGAPAPTC